MLGQSGEFQKRITCHSEEGGCLTILCIAFAFHV